MLRKICARDVPAAVGSQRIACIQGLDTRHNGKRPGKAPHTALSASWELRAQRKHVDKTCTVRRTCEDCDKNRRGKLVHVLAGGREQGGPPKKGPSYGRKMGPKKVKADCRPSQFFGGGGILVRIEGVIFRPPSLEKQHRETARPPSGTPLAAHATARGQTSHARSAKQGMQGSQ